VTEALTSEVAGPADSSARIRVAWLGHKSQTIGDGLRTYSRNVTGALAARGVDVTFVHHEPAMDDGRSSFALRGRPVFQRRLVIARGGSADGLARILRERAVDLVHVSFPFSTLDFSLPRLCHSLGIPIVATFHVPFSARWSSWGILAAGVHRLYVRALSESDRVIVFGSQQRALLVEHGVPERLIAILPNGVDLDRYSPGHSSLPERLGAERIFSYIGRIDPEKQVEAIVRAYLDVPAPTTTRLVIAGEGVDLARLRRRYRDERVLFMGAVLDERLRIGILRASDAFFLPSLLEAQSLALIEAMACGVAVVATPVGNHLELLEGAGAVVRPDHLTQDLRQAMTDLLRSPERCRTLGARARARAVDMFDLAAHAEGLIEAYDTLLGLSPARRLRTRGLAAAAR
jgi:glycosyltransferase involved in cell wall biosynthesis